MSKEFFNARAATWDQKAAEKDASRLSAMAARLDIDKGAAVLDVGTGTGIFVPYLLEKIGEKGQLTCLDFAEKMLDKARAKCFKGDIVYLCTDIENSNLPDESYSAAVCYSVFPHFNDKDKALREIYRLLKRGGKVFICHTSGRAHINKIHRGMPEVCDHLLPSQEEMRELFKEAGFRDISVEDRKDSYLAVAIK